MANENSVITTVRRMNFAKLTSGDISTIPKITNIALGDGGVDEEGNPIPPNADQTALNNEIARFGVEGHTYPSPTTVCYTITIPKGEEYAGSKFNEMALVDEAGNLCAIKTMYTKQKDYDVEFTFEFNDEF